MDRRQLLKLFAATGAGTALVVGSGSLKRAIASGNSSEWGYVGQTSPEHWGELSPDYRMCRIGSDQSPIDLQGAIDADLAEVEVYYQPIPLRILNNGHTVQVNASPGNRIVLDGEEFELKQFHFHHPSEHTVNEASFPMEAHFVHQNEKGEYAVLGVFLKEGAENAAFQPVWEAMPRQQSDEQLISDAEIDLNSLLPSERNSYRYFGSLTTPPCSETVKWVVFEAPVELSRSQLAQFEGIFPLNARPVQPLQRRFLLHSS